MKNKGICLFFLTFSLLLLSGCASKGKLIGEYKKLVEEKNYVGAQDLLNKEKLYANKESELLNLVENGSLHLYRQNYYQALQYFDQARDLSDKLFTVSVSKKITSSIVGEESDIYYGEKYERSLIRYYTILAHLNIYNNGFYEAFSEFKNDDSKKEAKIEIKHEKVELSEEQKRFHLQAARAVLIEWNSILEDYQRTYAGELTYKDDLLAKYLGAMIHLKMGSSSEKQIALNLLKESEKTKFRFYNSYQSFNNSYKNFSSNFQKFPSMKEEQVKKEFVLETSFSKQLDEYAQGKIKDWNKKQDNTYVVLHLGSIASKVAESIKFPINLGVGQAIATSDMGDFLSFSRGLLYISAGNIPLIEFEVAKIPYRHFNKNYSLVIKDGVVVKSEKAALLVNPLSEMAYQALDNESGVLAAKKGARLVTKHAAALVSAYLSYKSLKQSLGPEGARFAASLSYVAFNRGIAQSEKADLRSWTTLPSAVVMNSFSLSPGEYDLFLKDNETSTETKIGKVKVDGKQEINITTLFN